MQDIYVPAVIVFFAYSTTYRVTYTFVGPLRRWVTGVGDQWVKPGDWEPRDHVTEF